MKERHIIINRSQFLGFHMKKSIRAIKAKKWSNVHTVDGSWIRIWRLRHSSTTIEQWPGFWADPAVCYLGGGGTRCRWSFCDRFGRRSGETRRRQAIPSAADLRRIWSAPLVEILCRDWAPAFAAPKASASHPSHLLLENSTIFFFQIPFNWVIEETKFTPFLLGFGQGRL